MKKYVVFHIADYYPEGGMSDIAGSFDDLEEAKALPFNPKGDHYDEPVIQIVDRDTWEIVWSCGRE